MKQIDLHVHSTCSDGTDSPAVLVDKAVDKGLAAFALTDHDTTMGVKEALLACENVNKTGHELEVIPGVEISTNYDNTEIHVVGLFIDYNDNEFNSFLNKQLSSRDESMIHTFIAYDPDQSGDRDCYAPFIEGAFNVEPGKGQFVNEVMRLEVYDDEYEDDCVIQKKHFVYLPSVKFMGAFNMRMMMSMVDAQYN